MSEKTFLKIAQKKLNCEQFITQKTRIFSCDKVDNVRGFFLANKTNERTTYNRRFAILILQFFICSNYILNVDKLDNAIG